MIATKRPCEAKNAVGIPFPVLVARNGVTVIKAASEIIPEGIPSTLYWRLI